LFLQLPFVPNPTQPNPTQHKPTQSSKFCERLGQSAKRRAPVPGQARKGSYSDRQTSVWCGRAESKSGFCACQVVWKIAGGSETAALLPSCACAIMRNERVWYPRISSAQPWAEVPLAPSR
jgi:hypothetical protein